MPGKARWLLFEHDNDFHFDFYLAEQLRMPVWLMRRLMPEAERQAWGTYYGRRAQAEEMARLRAT